MLWSGCYCTLPGHFKVIFKFAGNDFNEIYVVIIIIQMYFLTYRVYGGDWSSITLICPTLKGQFHEIFKLWFFFIKHLPPPRQLIHTLKYF
jgi:hypothetical protein